MLPRRDDHFERTIASAWDAIERGDIEHARTLLSELPDARRREAARELVARRNDGSTLVPGDPELVLDLFERAHTTALSRIVDYAQGR